MIFTRAKLTISIPLLLKSGYSFDIIKQVDSTKFLGVYFDDSMTFKSHIIHLSRKLSRVAALLHQVKDLLPNFVLKRMYFAHAQSLLSYCNIIWSNTNSTDLNSLVLIQKRLIRIINKSDYIAHTRPLFRRSGILNIDNLRKLSLGTYCYKNRAKFHHLQASHSYSTRNRNMLRPIKHRTTHFEKSFVYQAPRIWNEISSNNANLINSNSISHFKRNYKKELLANN